MERIHPRLNKVRTNPSKLEELEQFLRGEVANTDGADSTLRIKLLKRSPATSPVAVGRASTQVAKAARIM